MFNSPKKRTKKFDFTTMVKFIYFEKATKYNLAMAKFTEK